MVVKTNFKKNPHPRICFSLNPERGEGEGEGQGEKETSFDCFMYVPRLGLEPSTGYVPWLELNAQPFGAVADALANWATWLELKCTFENKFLETKNFQNLRSN